VVVLHVMLVEMCSYLQGSVWGAKNMLCQLDLLDRLGQVGRFNFVQVILFLIQNASGYHLATQGNVLLEM
jgi:hypothetical protein